MKPLRLISGLVTFGGALVASSQAQLMHLSLTESQDSGVIFRATDPQIGWNHSGAYISRFDLWFDLDNPDDSSRNLWRMHVHNYELGDFEVIRSHDNLSFGEPAEGAVSVSLSHFNEGGNLDLTFNYWKAETPDPNLPLPQFRVTDVDLYFEAGRSFFDVPDLATAYGYGVFGRETLGVVESVDITPVPEPSTYGIGAAVVMGAVAIFARRRRRFDLNLDD